MATSRYKFPLAMAFRPVRWRTILAPERFIRRVVTVPVLALHMGAVTRAARPGS